MKKKQKAKSRKRSSRGGLVPPKRASRKGRGGVRSRRLRRFASAVFWVPPEPEAPKQAAEEEKPKKELFSCPDGLRPYHLERGCPWCIAEAQGVAIQDWPARCTVRIEESVQCADMAAASVMGHHWSCTFWDHTDGVPF